MPGAQSPFEQPPRPQVKLGAGLMIVGSLLAIIAVFLPWITGDESRNGTGIFIFDDGSGGLSLADNPGSVAIIFGVITAGLGLALFFAGRVLAVAIIGIVVAVIAELVGIGMIGIAVGTADLDPDASIGVGAVIQPIAPLLTLAGAIVCTAKRRRWPT